MPIRRAPIIVRGPQSAAIRSFRAESREHMLRRQLAFLGADNQAADARLARALRAERRAAKSGKGYDLARHFALLCVAGKVQSNAGKVPAAAIDAYIDPRNFARLCPADGLRDHSAAHRSAADTSTGSRPMTETTNRPKVVKTDAEWRAELTPEQYDIMRKHGTERAWSGPYLNEKSKGIYACAGCGAPLFSSETKYDSGSGWPSFYAPIEKDAVSEHEDGAFLMRRTEIRCAACEAHLGHVFPDGPDPTGQRFCMNGHALNLKKAEGKDGA